MRNFDEEYQVHRLGLERLLGTSGDFKILDVGCGRRMTLVKHLQQYGFNVEGIDSCPRKNYPGLIKQKVTAHWPENGCIPREQGYYDIVLAHQNPYFFESASSFRDTTFLQRFVLGYENVEAGLAEADEGTRIILAEMLRVTHLRGVTILYPGLDLLEKHFAEIIPTNRTIHHTILKNISEEDTYIVSGDDTTGPIVEDVSFSATHRTAIYSPTEIDPRIKRALEIPDKN